jgi:hypothetical protein
MGRVRCCPRLVYLFFLGIEVDHLPLLVVALIPIRGVVGCWRCLLLSERGKAGELALEKVQDRRSDFLEAVRNPKEGSAYPNLKTVR